VGLPLFYLSTGWWWITLTAYAMANLDDVTWGNRPQNTSGGMNIVVDDKKRQEIMRQSYRATRTNIVILWLFSNVSVMCILDSLVLSAIYNSNLALK